MLHKKKKKNANIKYRLNNSSFCESLTCFRKQMQKKASNTIVPPQFNHPVNPLKSSSLLKVCNDSPLRIHPSWQAPEGCPLLNRPYSKTRRRCQYQLIGGNVEHH